MISYLNGFLLANGSILAEGGFDSKLFYQQTGLPIIQIESGLKQAVELGLIEWHLHHIKPTEGFNLTGPLPADTLFSKRKLEQADAVLEMYHDQGLPV